MDEEKIKLLALIFRNDYPSDWIYDENFKKYLLKLGGYKVDDLSKEPIRLKDGYNNIQEQTQDLAVTNYKTFIETAECSKDLFCEFNIIESTLDELLVDIPRFQENCANFSEITSQISHLRKLNSLTLTRNAQLLEILELPQLMGSFINDGLYEDALELASYVRKLCGKFNDIQIFQDILKDVNQSWYFLLHQLLSQLKQDLSLPKCLQIVGHLRRMDIFTELELKLKFLQARGHYLDQCLKYIPKDDANHHLKKTIELTRVNLFNIITQYKAIFNDDDVLPLKNSVNSNSIFYTWINDKITDFLTTLEDDLKHVASLDTFLEQCMYFGASFSKVGCDFRLLLVRIFTDQIRNNFCIAITGATRVFEKSIENFTLINKNVPNIPWRNKDEDPLHSPDSIQEFYPLAEYLNNVLRTFNDFKLCAPLGLVNDVVDSLETSLVVIAKCILMLHSQEQQAFTNSSKDAFTRLCMSFSDDLIPYLQKCLHVIFPPNKISAKLGISMQLLQEQGITFLNKDLIIGPVKHLLPPKIEPSFELNDTTKDEKEEKMKDAERQETNCN